MEFVEQSPFNTPEVLQFRLRAFEELTIKLRELLGDDYNLDFTEGGIYTLSESLFNCFKGKGEMALSFFKDYLYHLFFVMGEVFIRDHPTSRWDVFADGNIPCNFFPVPLSPAGVQFINHIGFFNDELMTLELFVSEGIIPSLGFHYETLLNQFDAQH